MLYPVKGCYRGSPISCTELSLFPELALEAEEIRPPYKAVITEVADYNNDGAEDLADIEWLLQNKKNTCELLKGDGDFRSKELFWINLIRVNLILSLVHIIMATQKNGLKIRK
ncbi:MAG: hypothetical protein IJR49_05210 [Treponema sp.]|nr:hypothetical protein [Treponema sp.]